MNSLFVNQLTVLDCAYLDVVRGLVGESWIVDVELQGDLDAQSMVLDFGEVKRRLKLQIDEGLDHSLLVPAQADGLEIELHEEVATLSFNSVLGRIEHVSPPAAISVLPLLEIDEIAVARLLEEQLTEGMPPNVARLRVTLRPEQINGAYYHYVHGLKKHRGQCQRIAHGHRSRLEITVGGHRDTALEQEIALGWTDIYLGSLEDEVSRRNGRVRYAYRAPEGRFELELPEQQVDTLDADSTVERIAEHLVNRVKAARPYQPVEVRAFEGVMKGAIARGV